MTVNFFSKCLNFSLDFENVAKNWGKVFWFLDNGIWIDINKVSLLRRGYLPWAANVLISSPSILHVNKRYFFQLNWLGGDQEYYIKVMWCRFQQCLGTFTVFLVEGSSNMWLFRHLSNYAFGVSNFGNTKAMRIIFSSKTFKVSSRSQKCSKKSR